MPDQPATAALTPSHDHTECNNPRCVACRRERARQGLRMAVIEAQRAGISRRDVEDAVLAIHTPEDAAAAAIDARVRAEQEPREVTINWDDGSHEPRRAELTLRLWPDGQVTWR